MAELVRTSVTAALPRAAESGIRLRSDAPDRLEAHIDAARISQVLDNLVSNAIKYSPDGGDVMVSLRSEDGHMVCSVSDTGMGMSQQDQEEVFAKFFRSAAVRNSTIPGVGLGCPSARPLWRPTEAASSSAAKWGKAPPSRLPCRSGTDCRGPGLRRAAGPGICRLAGSRLRPVVLDQPAGQLAGALGRVQVAFGC